VPLEGLLVNWDWWIRWEENLIGWYYEGPSKAPILLDDIIDPEAPFTLFPQV
jgi:hypothetical protein